MSLVVPVWHCDHLFGKGGDCYLSLFLFIILLGVMHRLCPMIVAFPGHLLYYFSHIKRYSNRLNVNVENMVKG